MYFLDELEVNRLLSYCCVGGNGSGSHIVVCVNGKHQCINVYQCLCQTTLTHAVSAVMILLAAIRADPEA